MSLKHISGWVEVTEPNGPVDPGYGRPGWSPADPGYGIGTFPHPGHGLPGGGHISTGPIYGGGHPGNKPPGRPVLPPSVDNTPPTAPVHPWTPGHWDIIDPGWGKPPLIAFFPIDPGFGIPETPPPVVGGGPVPPDASTKPPDGVWVPTDPDYGVPCPPCPDKPKPPIWGWLPKPPDFKPPMHGGKPPQIPQPK